MVPSHTSSSHSGSSTAQLDRLHFIRLESIITRDDWDIFSVFTMNCQAHPQKVAALVRVHFSFGC